MRLEIGIPILISVRGCLNHIFFFFCITVLIILRGIFKTEKAAEKKKKKQEEAHPHIENDFFTK